mmetsp:Transcript_9557/g.17271  ORF Transcript_9557/g.17271 Transcript_9557/m.17271 type:complete len:112 (-) Transcript_9557:8-343(-)|eukprot:CAMPEP_0201868956 /NCGR_PEP_ID=MMETSP0902-20130614/2651_1 /ASSEMBLY_ACC=CAM_ASM_000551 /TAXON_ID=420261 /ORGANISM="Thalassiosira antarctica, Strain CCMP982" /LENGTH=111 /DNA_ID=CAMNT_0048394377 /DNA_START=101 /DNA_END=436 /DNA_ORIENTATION=+
MARRYLERDHRGEPRALLSRHNLFRLWMEVLGPYQVSGYHTIELGLGVIDFSQSMAAIATAVVLLISVEGNQIQAIRWRNSAKDTYSFNPNLTDVRLILAADSISRSNNDD